MLQLFLGEYIEASVIALLLVFDAALGLIHEGRAQATIAALKSRLALWASARRDGAWQNIPDVELVPGDLVKLSLGSVVAADDVAHSPGGSPSPLIPRSGPKSTAEAARAHARRRAEAGQACNIAAAQIC